VQCTEACLPTLLRCRINLFWVDQPSAVVGFEGVLEKLAFGVEQLEWLIGFGIVQYVLDELIGRCTPVHPCVSVNHLVNSVVVSVSLGRAQALYAKAALAPVTDRPLWVQHHHV
jgi:hypothetical protein